MNESRRKLLTEYIGECWHEWSEWRKDLLASYKQCKNCGVYAARPHLEYPNRTFTTPDDMNAVKEKMEEKGGWIRFEKFAQDKWSKFVMDGGVGGKHFSLWLFTPSRFCDLAGEWLERGGE